MAKITTAAKSDSILAVREANKARIIKRDDQEWDGKGRRSGLYVRKVVLRHRADPCKGFKAFARRPLANAFPYPAVIGNAIASEKCMLLVNM
jgi:hypothetical protein